MATNGYNTGIFYTVVWHFGASEASPGWFRASYASFTRATQRCKQMHLFELVWPFWISNWHKLTVVCCHQLLRWRWTRLNTFPIPNHIALCFQHRSKECFLCKFHHRSLRIVNSSPLIIIYNLLSLNANSSSASRITCSNSFWKKWFWTKITRHLAAHGSWSLSQRPGWDSELGWWLSSRRSYQKPQPTMD